MTQGSFEAELTLKGGFNRKPSSWQEVGSAISNSLLSSLPIYDAKTLGIDEEVFRTFKTTPKETIFLVERQGGLYLVRTEGADYARYVRYVGTAPSLSDPQTIRAAQ